MKVFYLANTIYSPAGMERVLITKANLLATRYGHEVTIVTNHQKGRPTFFPVDPKVRLVDLEKAAAKMFGLAGPENTGCVQ